MQPPKNASFPVQPNSIRGKIEHTPLESAIRRHFNALKNQSVEVPEWSEPGKPCILYFDPVTVAERIELDQYRDDYHARVLIMKARLPDGKPAFTLADLHLLQHQASALVVARLANRILSADAMDPKLLGESSAPAEKTDP